MGQNNELETARTELAAAAVNLLVVVGLLGSVIEKLPEHVVEGFIERIELRVSDLNDWAGEFMQFGEAFDEEV